MSSRKVSQSFRLYQLFTGAGETGVTAGQIARKIKMKKLVIGSYLAEFKRVYGATVNFDRKTGKYTLTNAQEVAVPKAGSAGRRSTEAATSDVAAA